MVQISPTVSLCLWLVLGLVVVGVVGSPSKKPAQNNKRSTSQLQNQSGSFHGGELNKSSGSNDTLTIHINDNGEICNAELDQVSQGVGTTGSPLVGAMGVNLPRCRKLEIGDIKKHTLLTIKQEILRKLRLDESRLPNVSAQGIPIPQAYLQEFISEYQGDSPSNELDDDEHATTEKIIAFSKIGEFLIPNNIKYRI